MSAISWDETLPASGTTASTVDDIIRSDITAIATVLGISRFWPGSAASQGASTASSGEMRPGTARPSHGANLRVGNAPNGTLVFDSDNSALAHAGSAVTCAVGHQNMEEHRDTVGIGTAHWVTMSGAAVRTVDHTDENDEYDIAFGVIYSVAPIVEASISSTAFLHGISIVTTGGFTSSMSALPGIAGGTSSQTVYWLSQGTAAY